MDNFEAPCLSSSFLIIFADRNTFVHPIPQIVLRHRAPPNIRNARRTTLRLTFSSVYVWLAPNQSQQRNELSYSCLSSAIWMLCERLFLRLSFFPFRRWV